MNGHRMAILGSLALVGLGAACFLLYERSTWHTGTLTPAKAPRPEQPGELLVEQPKEPHGGGARLQGRVVDAEGRPVARATVRLFEGKAAGVKGEPREPRRTDTDAAGGFELADVAPGIWSLLAATDGGLCGGAPSVEVPLEGAVVIVVEPCVSLEGYTLDPAGGPVSGAIVVVESQSFAGLELSAEADPTGRFALEGLDRGVYQVEARAPDHLSARKLVTVPLGAPVILRLEPARAEVEGSRNALRIRVVDKAEEPIEGLRVACEWAGGNGSGTLLTDPTGPDGWTALSDERVPLETALLLRASDPERGTATAAVDPLSYAGRAVVLRLESFGSLNGRVVDGSGEGIPGAEVIARGPLNGVGGLAETGGEGGFRFALPAGTWGIEVHAGRHGARKLAAKVESEKETDIIVPVGTEGAIVGQVLGPGGTPLEGVNVWVRSERNALLQRTDEDGWFSALVDPEPHSIQVGAKPFTHEPVTGVIPGGPPLLMRCEGPMRTISGVVLSPDGDTASNAFVRYYVVPGGGYRPHGLGKPVREDGTFEILNIEGERVIVTAHGPGFALAVSGEIEVPHDGRVEGVVVRPLAGANLRLRVLGSGGTPAGGMDLALSGDGVPPLEISSPTDRDGFFEVQGLPPGSYRLVGLDQRRQVVLRTEIEWNAGGSTLTVEIEGTDKSRE